MQYECAACGQLGRFWQESNEFTSYCPACDERTTWSPAFEREGVSF